MDRRTFVTALGATGVAMSIPLGSERNPLLLEKGKRTLIRCMIEAREHNGAVEIVGLRQEYSTDGTEWTVIQEKGQITL